MRKAQPRIFLIVVLLAIHASLVAWIAWRSSPTIDEIGHLPAGLANWQLGRFDIYPVNPPLVRLVAAAPVPPLAPATDWRRYPERPEQRNEWLVGRDFMDANGVERSVWFFRIARWACLPFALLGGWICFRWARELFGGWAGPLALTLWCFSPNVLGLAASITSDAPAAACGVAASYLFWRWLRRPAWPRALSAGAVLGLAELTKFSWVFLYALWPALWLLTSARRRDALAAPPALQAGQLFAMLLTAVYVVNAGYGFQGSFRKLGDYTFRSRALAGEDSLVEGGEGGNRFGGTSFGKLPVPFPEDYLMGMDVQRIDFEKGWECYLAGRWKRGGWWYWYLAAAAVKVPLGTWGLGVLALVVSWLAHRRRVANSAADASSRSWRDLTVLGAPAVVLFAIASSQTGMTSFFRYVAPCMPFAFIAVSRVAAGDVMRQRTTTVLASLLLAWSVGSSLRVYPYSHSYFNESCGGPANGHWMLVDANIDWGQDLLEYRRWRDQHPEARPLYEACLDVLPAGYDRRQPPPAPPPGHSFQDDELLAAQYGPQPGWYAISVHILHDPAGRFRYLHECEPVDRIGYSILIYHLTVSDANRLRAEFGLPAVDEP